MFAAQLISYRSLPSSQFPLLLLPPLPSPRLSFHSPAPLPRHLIQHRSFRPPSLGGQRRQSRFRLCRLNLSSSGNLLLYDPSLWPALVWSSDTDGKGVVHAQLLDSGNLVLLTSTSGSAYLWQSFNSPSDTLLAGQNFTTQSKPLLSFKRSSDFSSGIYSLAFSSLGVLQLSYTHIFESTSLYPQAYWAWGISSSNKVSSQSVFLQFDQSGRIYIYNSSSSITSELFSYDFGSLSSLRRLTLDSDGNLRMYGWDTTSSQWSIVWQAFTDGCSRVANVCGDYGICSYEPQPTCICPPEFSPVDSTDLSAGCHANYPANCSTNTYVEMIDLDFPYNDIHQVAFVGFTLEDCKQQCFMNCSCRGVVYARTGQGYCWLKDGMQNGQRNGAQQHHFVFLRVSHSDQSTPIMIRATNWITNQTLLQSNGTPSSTYQSNQPSPVQNLPAPSTSQTRKSLDVKLEIIFIALAVVIAAQVFCFAATFIAVNRKHRRTRRHMKLHADWGSVLGSPRVFNYEELEEATKKFSFKLGEGAFGKVYRGQLSDGKMVAVKQLEGLSLGVQEKQFKAEIATIGRIHHINLLSLVGFCAEDSHRLLVYDYLERGSLDKILFQNGENSGHIDVLEWETRFQICLGVARGIHYLHEECLNCILHCDIKPENILLDEHYCAKVADFGLAFLYSRDHTVRMTTIRGTVGYLAPEWVSNLRITAKADVYSYGMLIMEILSGRKNYMFTDSTMIQSDDRWYFPMWAYGKRADEVIDERIKKASINWKKADLLLKVAYECIQADMNMRPHMAKVVQMLEGTLPAPPLAPLSSFGFATREDITTESSPTYISWAP